MSQRTSGGLYSSLDLNFTESIAKDIRENIKSGFLYIFGPGELSQAILKNVDEPRGASIISCGDLKDPEMRLHARNFFEKKKVRIITCPDEDGYVLRDESKNLDPELLGMLNKECVQIIANMSMMTRQKGTPFIVETGQNTLNKSLSGYTQVITSYRRRAMYQIIAI